MAANTAVRLQSVADLERSDSDGEGAYAQNEGGVASGPAQAADGK
jgi:hypothetical protein